MFFGDVSSPLLVQTFDKLEQSVSDRHLAALCSVRFELKKKNKLKGLHRWVFFFIVSLQIKSVLSFSRELNLKFEQLHIGNKTHLVKAKKEA